MIKVSIRHDEMNVQIEGTKRELMVELTIITGKLMRDLHLNETDRMHVMEMTLMAHNEAKEGGEE